MSNPTYQDWKGIQVREAAPGSPIESFAIDSAKAEMRLYTPWDDRWAANYNLLGYSTVDQAVAGNASEKYIVRHTPMPHKKYPGYLYADSIRFEGDVPRGQDANGLASYEEAIATVGFSAPSYQVLTDAELLQQLLAKNYLFEPDFTPFFPDESSLLRYVTIRNNPKGKYQTVPSFSVLKWNVSGATPAERRPMSANAAVMLVESDLTVTWHQVPLEAIPWTAIYNCVGKTNRYQFGCPGSIIGGTLGVIGYARLVCLFPEIKIIRMPNGALAADIHYKFTVHPHGANYFYWWDRPEPNGPGFAEASRGGQGSINLTNGEVFGEQYLLFQPANFRKLFRAEP